MKRTALLAIGSVLVVASLSVSAGPLAASGMNAPSGAIQTRLAPSDANWRGGVSPAPFGPAAIPGSSDRNVFVNLARQVNDLTGTEARLACNGFRTVGECLAAAHVSRNLGIGFDSLRSKMVVGPTRARLIDAIEQLQPTADAKAEARRAHEQARSDVEAARI